MNSPLLALIAFAACAQAAPETLNTEAAKIGFTLGAWGKLPVDFSQVKQGEKLHFTSLRAQNKTRRIEVQSTSPLEAEEGRAMARQKIEIISKQYGAQRTPYPGEFTNTSECKAKDKPLIRSKDFKGLRADMLVGFASGRYSFGECDKLAIKNVGFIGYFYLPASKTLVEVRAFSPYPGTAREKLFSVFEGLGLIQ